MRTEMGSYEMAERAFEVGSQHDPYRAGRDSRELVSEDGTVFKIISHGADRVALLANDGVVYKVTHSQCWGGAGTGQSKQEIGLFDYLDSLDIGWCPDYWQYCVGFNVVVAMKHYDPIQWCSGMDERLEAAMSVMDSVSDDVDVDNMGMDPDTGTIVLLDGGVSEYDPGVTDDHIKGESVGVY